MSAPKVRRFQAAVLGDAFLFRDRQQFDLNALVSTQTAWTLEKATGINDRGQIVGQGLHHGRERAFLLTPIH